MKKMKSFIVFMKHDKEFQKYLILFIFLFVSMIFYKNADKKNQNRFFKPNDVLLNNLLSKSETDQGVVSEIQQKEKYMKKGDIYAVTQKNIFTYVYDKIQVFSIAEDKKIHQIDCTDYYVHELYTVGDYLYVLGNQKEKRMVDQASIEIFYFSLRVIDTNDFKEVRRIDFYDSYFRYAKQIEDELHFVLNNNQLYNPKENKIILPTYKDTSNPKETFSKNDIMMVDYNEVVHFYTLLIHLDLKDLHKKVESKILLGSEGMIEFLEDKIIIVSPVYDKYKSVIHILNLSNYKYLHHFEVDGYLYMNDFIYYNPSKDELSLIMTGYNDNLKVYQYAFKNKKLNSLDFGYDFNNAASFSGDQLLLLNKTKKEVNLIELSDTPKIIKKLTIKNQIEFVKMDEERIVLLGKSEKQDQLVIQILDHDLIVHENYQEKMKDFYIEAFPTENITIHSNPDLLVFPIYDKEARQFLGYELNNPIKKVEFKTNKDEEEYLTRFFPIGQDYYIFSNKNLYKYDHNYALKIAIPME